MEPRTFTVNIYVQGNNIWQDVNCSLENHDRIVNQMKQGGLIDIFWESYPQTHMVVPVSQCAVVIVENGVA